MVVMLKIKMVLDQIDINYAGLSLIWIILKIICLGPLLLTWTNFNHNMDK